MENQEGRRITEIIQKVRQIEVRTRRLVNDNLAGIYHSTFKGYGMNFEEVREYSPGDDIRAIDWNVTARTGRPYVKKFTEEREVTLMLMIDISRSGDFGSTLRSKRECMAEIGSMLAFSAIRNRDKVGLTLFTDSVELYIPPGKGHHHILRIIREILFFQPKGEKTDIGQVLDFSNKIMKRKCVVFLLSDFCLPGNFSQQLQLIAPKIRFTSRRHDLISLVVSDPREYTLPDIGWITLEDSESGEQIELNTSDPVLRESFRTQSMTQKKDLFTTLRANGADPLDLMTSHDNVSTLSQFFKTRQRRRS